MLARIWRTTLYYKSWRFLSERFTKRQLKAFVWVFAAVMFLGSAAAVAADGQTTPTGFGDMVVMPDLAQGQDKTMMESYPLEAWQLDSELSTQDVVQNVMYGVDQILFFLLKTLVYLTVGLVYWLFSFTNIAALSDGTASLIGGASAGLMTWLFPSAVAIGAAVTYAMRQRDGNHNYNQIAWFLAAGIFTISLTTSAPLWVQTVDNVRTIGTTATSSMADPLMTEQQEIPFAAPQKATFNGTPTQNVLRKSADSLWRSLLATPWCISNYGSMEACKRYGPDMLAMGGDTEMRKNDYIKDIIYGQSNPENKPTEGSKEAATSQWVKGERYADRTGILVLAIIVALVFCLLLLSLGYAAVVSLAMAFMLLVAGVFFAMLWIIPGRPRQWGSRWFDTLLGTIMTSVVATLTFTVVMMFTATLFNLTGEYGWATATGLALVIVAAGFKLRASLETVFDAYNPNAARAAAVGFLASRAVGKGAKSVTRGAGRLARGLGRAGRHYKGQLSENPPTGGPGGRGNGSPRGGGPGGRTPYRPNVPTQPTGPSHPLPANRRPSDPRGPGRPTQTGPRSGHPTEATPQRDTRQRRSTRHTSPSPSQSVTTTPVGYKPQSRTLLTTSPRSSTSKAPRQVPAPPAYRPTAPAQPARRPAVQPVSRTQQPPMPRRVRGGDDGR
ncbi:hypothetical protein [Pseudarthrobacter sp. J47]|uniref:hypothetical protein n=1 Tax=Pseudarthrobacter sp. J47 TaxID=3116482 RepID=UPI002E81A119|nr:hypothetical protein [Pseudarthrobacter sp. J47]MEE2524540.1 hypothetical protein [Pseudarthrobacter sp. J47]